MSLGTNNADYLSFYSMLKGNYRKGVHRFRTLLENPYLAEDFSKSVGAVSVVLGWPIGHDDKNSQELLSLLQGSEIITQATITWLGQWYPENTEDADSMYGDATRCQEIRADALLWRAVSWDPVGVGKLTATLAGLAPASYDDIAAVVASDSALQAVIASPAALDAVVSSQTAMAAVIASPTALDAVVSSSTAMTAVAASQTAMAAVAGSYVAVAAIWASPTAVQAVQANAAAWATFTGANSQVMGKAVATLAGLDPAGYADMTAVAASQTAMTAVRASAVAMNALAGSTVAYNALLSSPLLVRYNPVNANSWRTDTVHTGSGIFVRLVSYNGNSNWYKLDGGSQVTLAAKDSKVVKAYRSSLQVYWVDYNESERGVYYIPC